MSDSTARYCFSTGAKRHHLRGPFFVPLSFFCFASGGWLVFVLLSHERSREGMASVSGVSAKLSAGSVTDIQAGVSCKDPRSWCGTLGPHLPKILMLYFFNFTFYCRKIFKYKSKTTVMNLCNHHSASIILNSKPTLFYVTFSILLA